MIDRVILVGFMCSGKSTIGEILAGRLGWGFIDFDAEIERSSEKRVAEIFRDSGEPAFRRMEAEITRRVASSHRTVLAPGGGWMARPELVDLLRPRSLLVWLRARPETIYRRHIEQASERPLLAVERPLEAIGALLAKREVCYMKADVTLDTDECPPGDLAGVIAERLEAAQRAAEPGGR